MVGAGTRQFGPAAQPPAKLPVVGRAVQPRAQPLAGQVFGGAGAGAGRPGAGVGAVGWGKALWRGGGTGGEPGCLAVAAVHLLLQQLVHRRLDSLEASDQQALIQVIDSMLTKHRMRVRLEAAPQ